MLVRFEDEARVAVRRFSYHVIYVETADAVRLLARSAPPEVIS